MLRRYSEFLHYFQPRHSMHEDIPDRTYRSGRVRALHRDTEIVALFTTISECMIARHRSSPRYITYRRVPRVDRIGFALRGGTWLGISNVRTRQTKLITIIASTTFSIAPTPRAERS